MIRDILQTIPGIRAFPIIGLVLFMTVFIGVIVWAFFKIDKRHIKHMEELPLDSSHDSSKNGD